MNGCIEQIHETNLIQCNNTTNYIRLVARSMFALSILTRNTFIMKFTIHKSLKKTIAQVLLFNQ